MKDFQLGMWATWMSEMIVSEYSTGKRKEKRLRGAKETESSIRRAEENSRYEGRK